MMRLNRALIRSRIALLYGGSVSRLADHVGVNRSTVFRWLDDSADVFPRTDRDLLALGAALNLDPALLWIVCPGSWPSLCHRGRAALHACRLGRLLPALEFAEDLVAPDKEWPPAHIAAPYERPWHVVTLPRVRFAGRLYAPAKLDGAVERAPAVPLPQVWHFARCDVGAPAGPTWDALGLVVRVGRRVTLFEYNGIRIDLTLPERGASVVVLLPIDGRALSYRVASLHPFSAQWCTRDAAGSPHIRFCSSAADCEHADEDGRGPCPLRRACEASGHFAAE